MSGLGDLVGVAALGPYIRSGQGACSGAAQQAYHNAVMQHQLANQRAFNDIYRPANIAQPKPSNVTPIRPLRTPEEIQAQLEARYAEMEAEAERLRIHALTACSACRWGQSMFCEQPLVMGVKRKRILTMDSWKPQGKEEAYLCGPEKALWEPIPTRWQRFMEWLAKIIEHLEGRAIQKGAE